MVPTGPKYSKYHLYNILELHSSFDNFRTVTREETEQMFEELYTSKETIVIRDVKMCINLQTIDSRINFMSHGESHTLKVVRRGVKVEEEVFKTQDEMFNRVRQLNVKALGP